MIQTWLKFPLRLGICLISLSIILFWQFNFDLGAYYYQLAHVEQHLDKDYSLAVLNYQLSLSYRPQHATTAYQMGIVLMRSGQIDEAIISLENALAWGYPQRQRILPSLIQMLEARGRDAQAREYQAELDNE